MASKLPVVGPFPLGVNNRKHDHELTASVGREAVDLLRSAVNVDVSSAGKLRRREGFELVHAGRAHSAWGDDKAGFYAEGSTLYCLGLPAGGVLARTVVRDDLAPSAPLSYCEAGGTYYYTNGQEIGMVRAGARLDFTPAPLTAPTLAVVAGAMAKGRYQVCITHFGPAGESAATPPCAIDLPAGGGIRIGGIPPAPPGCITQVYITGADGEVFGRTPVDIASGVADIVAPPAMGAGCQTLLLQAMPPGGIVRFTGGRLLVASGALLIYSEPFMPGLWRPGKNYIPFSAPITVVEPCGDGVFVVADKTYWLAGEISQTGLTEVLPYGAVPHSGGRDFARPDACFWVSDRGLVLAAPGAAKNVQEEQLALAGGAVGASVLRERDGQRHVLTAVRDPERTSAGVGCRFDTEIVRKGVKQ